MVFFYRHNISFCQHGYMSVTRTGVPSIFHTRFFSIELHFRGVKI